MSDRVSSFVIGFDGDAGNLNLVLAAIKTSIRSAVSDIQAASNKVELFGKLEQDVKAAGDAFQAAKVKVADPVWDDEDAECRPLALMHNVQGDRRIMLLGIAALLRNGDLNGDQLHANFLSAAETLLGGPDKVPSSARDIEMVMLGRPMQ